MRIEDLRRELHEQARESEAWELPPLRAPRREASPARAAGLVLLVAALVAAVLLVPRLAGPAAVPGATVPVTIDVPVLTPTQLWRGTAPSICTPGAPACVLPEALETGGTAFSADGSPSSSAGRARAVGLDLAPEYVLAGSAGAGPRSRLALQVSGFAPVELPTGRPALVRLPAERAEDATVTLRQDGASGPDETLLLAGYVPDPDPAVGLAWEDTTWCRPAECELPEELEVEGRTFTSGSSLVSDPSPAGADVARIEGTLASGVDGPASWILVGAVGSDSPPGSVLAVDVEGLGSVVVSPARPRLIRLPDRLAAQDDVTVLLRQLPRPVAGTRLVVAQLESSR